MAEEPTKEFARVDYSVFHNTMKLLDCTAAKLCTELGYSDHSWHSWSKVGKMPKVAAIACEAIQRRNGHTGVVLLVKTITKEQALAVHSFAKALGITVSEV